MEYRNQGYDGTGKGRNGAHCGDPRPGISEAEEGRLRRVQGQSGINSESQASHNYRMRYKFFQQS